MTSVGTRYRRSLRLSRWPYANSLPRDNRASLSEEGRGLLAVKTLGLRTFTSNVALEVTPRVYDFAGGRMTGSSYALDRFWRDARMLTMHDPMLYSIRIVGYYGLNDKVVMFPSRFPSQS